MNSVNEGQYELLRDLLGDNFSTLINTYIEDNSTRITLLGSSLNAENWQEVRQLAHSMKSSAANIGATNLAELCQRIEHDSQNNFRNVETNYDKLQLEFKSVVMYLQEHL